MMVGLLCMGCCHKYPVYQGSAIIECCDHPGAPDKAYLDNYDSTAPDWCPLRLLKTSSDIDIERKTIYIPTPTGSLSDEDFEFYVRRYVLSRSGF